jgi:prevent-host-death family protein
MLTVGAYEAKTHLSRLLDEVGKGETVTITKHGVPVAKLVPPDEGPINRTEAVERIREFARKHRLGGLTPAEIKEMIAEGRR